MIPTIGSFRPDLDFISYARISAPHLFLLNSIALNTRKKKKKRMPLFP